MGSSTKMEAWIQIGAHISRMIKMEVSGEVQLQYCHDLAVGVGAGI